jgi:SNW domain-containing protein 1
MEVAGKKQKRDREEDRDVSERIALGQAAQPTNVSGESMFDARLFNQSAGLDTGFGSDDKYDMYDKPLFADKSQSGIYRHDKDRMEQTTGKLGSIGNSFEGAESKSSRTRPVEFEQDAIVGGDDITGINKLMKEAGKR